MPLSVPQDPLLVNLRHLVTPIQLLVACPFDVDSVDRRLSGVSISPFSRRANPRVHKLPLESANQFESWHGTDGTPPQRPPPSPLL